MPKEKKLRKAIKKYIKETGKNIGKKSPMKKKVVTDPVKAAKKEIRKGKNKPGFATVRAQVVDKFGREHGYQSDAAKELYSSRLVQRKMAQETRQKASSPSERKEARERNKLRKAEAKVMRLELDSKESPYKMYGKTSSPLEGGSPLAKYGCSKKHKK